MQGDWLGTTGRNQQRRTALLAEDRSAGISMAEIAFADHAGAIAGMRSKLCLTLWPARTMALRTIVAARKDSSAVTGPWTTEYGPAREGKKKIVSTLRTAITASAQAIFPGLMISINYTWWR